VALQKVGAERPVECPHSLNVTDDPIEIFTVGAKGLRCQGKRDETEVLGVVPTGG
jgi:hypothetical protein